MNEAEACMMLFGRLFGDLIIGKLTHHAAKFGTMFFLFRNIS